MSSRGVKKHAPRPTAEVVKQFSGKKPQPPERRAQPRFTAQFRSTFSGRAEEWHGRTLDISIGGCRIESHVKVAQGATFECRLHVPGLDWPIRIDEALVRWVEGDTFGIAFTRARSEELAKVKKVLANLEQNE